MRSRRFIFYSTAALLAVLVFLVYYDLIVFQASDLLRPWYYDMVEHFLGGIIVSGLFIYYSALLPAGSFPKSFFLYILMAASFVALVALGWELYEYYANILGQMSQNPISDTLSDMVLGVSGAVLGAVMIYRKPPEK